MFKDYVEKEKESSIPVALREISFDYAEKFTLIRCLAVLSAKVIWSRVHDISLSILYL